MSSLDKYKYHFVYLTTNLINNKFYIGKHSTNDLNDGYLGSGTLIQKAIEKYGKENFKREILEFCESSDSAYLKEEQIIDNFNAVELESFYNLTLGGSGNKGYIPNFTEEWKQKISKSLTGKVLPEEHRKNIGKARRELKLEAWNKGKTDIYSEETLKSISESLKKYYEENDISEETIEKIRSKLKGRVSPMKDKTHKEESKKQTSETCKRVLNMPDKKFKMSEAAKNLEEKICPYCGVKSKGNVIYRYHFENCKFKK